MQWFDVKPTIDKGSYLHSIEQKYIFIGQQKQMILDWLDHTCIRDPLFYSGTVSSIYYDSPRMNLYMEKRNSDFLKTKVRLRWYEKIEEFESNFGIKCYLEVKNKIGATREKKRIEVLVSSKKLSHHPFSEKDILNMPSKVLELGELPRGILVPMLLIKYDRFRFIDLQSNSRVSVDINIQCARANNKYLAALLPVNLGMGVLEVKGNHRQLPNSFREIGTYLTKESFSKYAQCFERLMLPLERSA